MGSHAQRRRGILRRTIGSTRVRALLSLGVLVGFGTVSTMAYWTASVTVAGETFTTGSLDIKLDGQDDDPAGFASAMQLSDMRPGDRTSAVLDVQNAGTVGFTYTIQGRATGALAPYLTFTVVPGGTLSGDTCTGTPSYTDTLGASYVAVSSADRLLEPGDHESVCVTAAMPTGTTGGQGLSTTADLVFDAKQVGAP